MCGILGIVSNNKVTTNNFKNALNKLKHRGPDDEGYLLFNRDEILQFSGPDTVEPLKRQFPSIDEVPNFKPFLFLGHRRLSIIDLSSAGHQPMEYNNGNLWIIYNGEIYNYKELRKELEKDGYKFKTNTDTEVILASYLKWGYECLNKFNGMWAFCIWDKRKNVLFCARDRFGVKPFYYYFDGDSFAFASEIKALIDLPFINTAPNSEAIIPYLYFGLHDFGEQTFFQGIKQLLPGHFLIFDINTKDLEIKRYYDIRFNSELGTYDEKKAKLYSEEFFNLFKDAVKLRLRSDVPVGSCLSGGLDSSSIVCMMSHLLKKNPEYQRVTGNRIRSFTADFHNFHLSEKKYVDEILSHYDNIEGYFVYPDADMLKKDLYDLIYYQEEPFGSLSIYAQYCVMRLAKNHGVKVLLDGQGGDELLAGYIHKHVPIFLANCISECKILNFLKEKNLLNIRYLISTFFLFLPENIQYKYLKNFAYNRYHVKDDKKIENEISNYLFKGFENLSLNENLKNEIKYRLPRLLKYEDRNSMTFNIESRLPFLDYRLVEFLLNLPAVYKIHNGYNKWILRESMINILLEKNRLRKDKIGFAVPQKELLESIHLWDKEIYKDKFVLDFLTGYININKITSDFDNLLKKETCESFKGILWRTCNLGLWWKQFFKQK
jgi:asparagine synthase (glutamine-hydrolysing)